MNHLVSRIPLFRESDTTKKEYAAEEAINQDIKKRLRQKKQHRIEQTKHASIIEQLLGQQSEQTKTQIMRDSFQKQTTETPLMSEQALEALEEEIDRFFKPKPSPNDRVEVSKKYSKQNRQSTSDAFHQQQPQFAGKTNEHTIHHYKKQKKDTMKSWIDMDDPIEDTVKPPSEKKTDTSASKIISQHPKLQLDTVHKFSQIVLKYVTSKDSGQKHRMEAFKKKLFENGIPHADIDHMSTKVGQLIHAHIHHDIKKKMLHLYMAMGESKFDISQATHALNQHQQSSINPGPLNAFNHQSIDRLKFQSRQELTHFLFEESSSQITKYSIGAMSLTDYETGITKLLKIASSAGIQINQAELEASISQTIQHLGLAQFSSNPQSSSQQNTHASTILSQEDALDDKLRYLYMMKALHPNLRQHIQLAFKMKKCRNGMIKLGLYSKEKDEKIKKEGYFLASKQYEDHLEFVFREEATLATDHGPEYTLLQKKKAFYIKQLETIHYKPSKQALQKMKHAMYNEMSDLIKEEIITLEEVKQARSTAPIARSLKHLNAVLTRISTHYPSIPQFQDSINHQQNIKEFV